MEISSRHSTERCIEGPVVGHIQQFSLAPMLGALLFDFNTRCIQAKQCDWSINQ